MPNHETAARFRRRAEIEARQWTGSNANAMSVFCSPFDFQTIDPEDRVEDPDQTAAVRTHPHGGWVGLKPGDWVVREAGRYTTASDEEFRADWEPASSAVSVVPPATNQTALLRWAADAVGALDRRTIGISADTIKDAWEEGRDEGADLLRRLADEPAVGSCVAAEAPHAETPDEAHPAEHSWAAELHDPLADEWVPGTRYTDRDRAVNALTHAKRLGPTWKDGTPTQRRLVRATTTYTVEADPAPAVVAQPGKET